MGELVRLPTRRKAIVENTEISGAPSIEVMPDKCCGYLHVFAGVPGQCECGETTWDTLPEGEVGIHHHVA